MEPKMNASADSRNCDSAQDATAHVDRTPHVFAEDWAGDEDGEITTPRLSLALAVPLAVESFRPSRRGVFRNVVRTAERDMSDRDWPSAMAAAAGPARALIADARGFTGRLLELRPAGDLS
jgi:hypothetical protein